MSKRWLWTVAMAAGFALASGVQAQTTQEAQSSGGSTVAEAQSGTPAQPEDPNTGALTLTGGVDWTTAYFFRGYNQEDGGLILQPYATLTANVYNSDKFNINVYGGTWNSFQSAKTGSDGNGPSSWYECDLFGGVDFSFDKFTVGVIYTFYQYPNGAFKTIQEVGFKLSYDDTDLMKKTGVSFGLKPYVGVYIETDDGNGTEDTYAEVGIGPSWTIHGVTLSVPVAVGMSLDDYYLQSDGSNSFFGYGSISLLGSIPLPIPARYGAWTLTAGVQYLYLFADSAEAANNGENDQWIGKVGVAFSY